MSTVKWTDRQRQVIESRGTNLLVSAAAGSGKTAVLVERIIRMITEGEHPLDIDQLLVMTFTNAAAAEMRERIGAAIEARLLKEPDNEHLQIQSALIHHAQITTIDSFCLNVIREHFNLLDLDPSFRIGDEGELMLLRQDVMAELLEEAYSGWGERFERFVDTFGQGKSDAGMEEYILKVYQFSQSNPYPDQWIAACRRELENREHFEDTRWMQFLLKDAGLQLRELTEQMEESLSLCQEDEYLQAYVPMLENDIRKLQAAAAAEGFEDFYQRLTSISWDRLATVRSKEADLERKAYVTGCRDRMKKAVAKMQELYCYAPPEELIQDMEGTGEAVAVLLDLAEAFDKRFQEKKQERNLVDFNDLEHQALKVLIRPEEGKPVYTEAADELSRQFAEVLVDEYQDSNLVQEALLHAVSRERFGQNNIFMVGDVKQSIYKFRLARPELFLEKQETYEPYDEGEGNAKKIELHQNFRSRPEVLSGVNDVFFQIMTENLGNIRYTDEAALHPGAEYAKPSEEAADGHFLAGIPELLAADTGAGALDRLDEEAADFTAREMEAKMIVSRIRKMTDPSCGMLVWDKRAGGYRPAQYRDIVILLRSTAGWMESLMEVLMNEGIPAYAESRTGYFNTLEVETVLSFLAVIDNPMQDIPLAASLKSWIGGVTDEELARLMAWYRGEAEKGQDRGIYGAMKLFVSRNTDPEDELFQKLRRFEELVSRFADRSIYLPIHQLIYQIYEETGYYHLVSAMPAGETRKANLDMLVEKAVEYERTSYKGLFHFVRYIENLKKYHTDFGEAATSGEADNTVRIMSIHKSKGLEFPIVFLAGMGKKFNKQDAYGKLLIDPELGIATDYLDLEHRVKATTLKKNVLRRKMELDNLGEELRILYVAMTRAREQLIMTGTDRYLEKTLEKYRQVPVSGGQIPYTILAGAGSYLDWMLMCFGGRPVGIKFTQVSLMELVGAEMKRQVTARSAKDYLAELAQSASVDTEYRKDLLEGLDYTYPYQADIGLHTKMSVSELKKQGQLTDEAESEQMQGPLAGDGDNPHLLSVSRETWRPDSPLADGGNGAARGTAFHRAMELLPFSRMKSRGDVEACLERLVSQNQFTRENFELLDCGQIWAFLTSELGQRMTRAEEAGRLYKEQQFVIGMEARQMGAGDSGELVVIQGIIDAYFEEPDGLVIMDYKTDRVSRPETLVNHYKTQLDYYERALIQMTGKPVKEKLIYSAALNQVISC